MVKQVNTLRSLWWNSSGDELDDACLTDIPEQESMVVFADAMHDIRKHYCAMMTSTTEIMVLPYRPVINDAIELCIDELVQEI